MSIDKWLIAPFKSGLQTSMSPWMIPEDSFEELRNAYVFRGKVRKRFGSQLTGVGAATSLQEPLFSRLRYPLTGGAGVGTTDGAGVAAGNVPGAIWKIGQQFSIGDEIYTVYQANGATLSTGAGAGTFNTATGAYTFAGSPVTTQVYFYLAEPVMGISQYEAGVVNDHVAYAFDTQFIYKFSGGSWSFDGPTAPAQLHGSNAQFFLLANADGVAADNTNMFISNFNATIGAPGANDDPMWTYNGAAWAAFSPDFTVAGDNIYTAKIIFPFKDRLVLLNTIEQNAAGTLNSAYVNRCRYSHNGSPLAASAFYEPDEVGATGAGFIDAPTEEEMVSAGFIRDKLIVYFERSTWELAYTYNHEQPFIWQKINSEIGSEATHSLVSFDKTLLTIGTSGINACNGVNVERIDKSIPDEVFEIVNKFSGIVRIQGIRDYFTEMVYWSFPAGEDDNNNTYPNRILAYNYDNGTWAFNDDCITCFGSFEQATDMTWATCEDVWNAADYDWVSGLTQANFRQVVAGNQQGYIFVLNPAVGYNSRAMQITNMAYVVATQIVTATIIDHTLKTGDYIKISDAQGVALGGYGIYQIARVDADTITFSSSIFAGAYTGGGMASRVSKIQIKSKAWNPYVKENDKIYLSRIDFCVSRNNNGEITVDYTNDLSNLLMIEESNEALGTGALLGTNVLETSPYPTVPMEATQDILWHSVYFQAEGNSVQIYMTLKPDQITVPVIAESFFELQGMVLHTQRVSE